MTWIKNGEPCAIHAISSLITSSQLLLCYWQLDVDFGFPLFAITLLLFLLHRTLDVLSARRILCLEYHQIASQFSMELIIWYHPLIPTVIIESVRHCHKCLLTTSHKLQIGVAGSTHQKVLLSHSPQIRREVNAGKTPVSICLPPASSIVSEKSSF